MSDDKDNKKKELLTLTSLKGAEINLTQDAFDLKFELLGKSAAIKAVSDFASHEAAAGALREISTLLASIETSRKEVKAPVLELGKRIDDVAKNYVGELSVEKDRLSRAIGGYVADQERLRREEERKQREEQERIRREEEERQRKLDEEKRKADEALKTNPADAEALRRKLDAEKAAQEAAAAPKVVVPIYVPTSAKVAGTRVMTTRKFEIIDENKLFGAHPELFVPSEQKIRDFVKSLPSAETAVAGLRIWEESKASSI